MGGVTTFWAPANRALARTASTNTGLPLNAAASMDFLASGLQDHRLPYNSRGSSSTVPGIVGWYGGAKPEVINLAPTAAATANIAALANVTSGTAMTLVSSSGAGIIVASTSAPATYWPTGTSQTSGVVIENLPGLQMFGTGGNFTTGFYDPSKYVGRVVSITAAASATGGDFLVAGYDTYGYAMTETITAAAGASTTNGLKAWKGITSVTPQFTDAHNYSVGTADIFGLGILATYWSDITVYYNSVLLTAATGFVTADTTDPATATTGDVRGTYAVQSATDGSKRLVVYVSPTLASIVSNATTGLFGVTQA